MYPIQRAGLVRTVIETRNYVVRSREWIVFVIEKVRQSKPNVVFVVRHNVKVAAVNLLGCRIPGDLQQILRADQEVRRGSRKDRQQPNACGTEAILGNDISREAALT